MHGDDLKQRIQQRMKELGWKSAPLSKAAGLNPTYVRDLLRTSEPNPRLRHLQALAEQLETNVGWLVEGKEPEAEIVRIWNSIPSKKDKDEVISFAQFKAYQSD
ncbi:helix-turn-helix domain-containing protein [Hyphomonas sp.]|uniref:helix-turn-helix domain-containing protein n=1 Tax=Hyphomonas sp. TaxID=87 RepID=UPI003002C310